MGDQRNKLRSILTKGYSAVVEKKERFPKYTVTKFTK